MSKIAILGGTFSPIHLGHMRMAESAIKYGMDEVWFLPSAVSYLKEGTGVIACEERLAMTKLAIEGIKNYSVSTIEIDRGGNSYSYETMESLKEIYPNHEFYFVLGADSIFSLQTWKNPERLMKACELLTVVRDDVGQWHLLEKVTELEAAYGARIHILPMENTPVSSTEIRKFYHEGGQHHPAVSESVDAYILEHQLYR